MLEKKLRKQLDRIREVPTVELFIAYKDQPKENIEGYTRSEWEACVIIEHQRRPIRRKEIGHIKFSPKDHGNFLWEVEYDNGFIAYQLLHRSRTDDEFIYFFDFNEAIKALMRRRIPKADSQEE